MLTLRPTKVLAKRLGLPASAVVPPVQNRVADWCVQEFREGGFRFLLFCNTASLYPLVAYGRGVTDDGSLIERAIETMKNSFMGTELEFQFQRWIVPELGVVQWAPIPDKAVLSSVNEMISHARYGIIHRDYSPVDMSRWLAQTPMKAIGYNSPDRVFPGREAGVAIDRGVNLLLQYLGESGRQNGGIRRSRPTVSRVRRASSRPSPTRRWRG